MKASNPTLGKIFYTILFLFIIPVSLLFWAEYTSEVIQSPVVSSVIGGYVLIILGALLLIWGMLSIWIYGHGLPMNAYPPEKFVDKGPSK